MPIVAFVKELKLICAIVIFLLLLPAASAQPGDASVATLDEGGAEGDASNVNRIAVMTVQGFGIIKFELYENWTPVTTTNFIELAESGHYNGVLFHRIVDDFVIQTGDGGGGSTIPLETNPNATHIDGAVGMARSSDPDSAADQFYICDGPQHGLDDASVNPDGQDPGYAVFGVVIEGMEVVRAIAQTPVYGENNPRPGAIIPLLWQNTGTPKVDVILESVVIEDPNAENETLNFTVPTGSISGDVWPVLVLPAAFVLVAAYWWRTKRKSGHVDDIR